MKKVLKKIMDNKILWIILIIYGLLNLYLVYIHEPWRDEIHAWLMAKSYSIGDLIKESRFDGHPILWNLILMPFAKLGAPIITLNLVSYGMMLISAYLVLFKIKMPLLIKIIALFTIPFTYAFSAISRNYTLVIMIMTIIGVYYDKRSEKPILYSILIALLVHTHALAWGLVAGLTLSFHFTEIINYFRSKKNTANIKKVVGGLLIIVVSTILVVLELYGNNNPNYGVIADDYVNQCLKMMYMIMLCIVLLAIISKSGYKGSFVILMGFVFQIIIYKFFYSSILFQRLILIYAFLFFYVMLTYNEGKNDNYRWMNYALYLVFLVFGCISFFDMMVKDIKEPFSAAKDMANYINKNLRGEELFYIDALVIGQTMIPYLNKAKLYDIVYEEEVTSANRPYDYVKVLSTINNLDSKYDGIFLIVSNDVVKLDYDLIYEANNALVNETFTLYYINRE